MDRLNRRLLHDRRDFSGTNLAAKGWDQAEVYFKAFIGDVGIRQKYRGICARWISDAGLAHP
jgi:hypothetical protein